MKPDTDSKFDIKTDTGNSAGSQESDQDVYLPLVDSKDINLQGYRMQWDYNSVVFLIETYKKYRQEFSLPHTKKMNVWKKISMEMESQGYDTSSEVCDKKFRSLKGRYKIIRNRNTRAGKGGKTWEFYNMMDSIFDGDPSVTSFHGYGDDCDQKPNIGAQSPDSSNSSWTFITIPPGKSRESSPDARTPPSPTQFLEKKFWTSPSTALHFKKKRRRHEEPPEWFLQFIRQQDKRLEQLALLQEESNTLQKKMVDIQKERNELLAKVLKKFNN